MDTDLKLLCAQLKAELVSSLVTIDKIMAGIDALDAPVPAPIIAPPTENIKQVK